MKKVYGIGFLFLCNYLAAMDCISSLHILKDFPYDLQNYITHCLGTVEKQNFYHAINVPLSIKAQYIPERQIEISYKGKLVHTIPRESRRFVHRCSYMGPVEIGEKTVAFVGDESGENIVEVDFTKNTSTHHIRAFFKKKFYNYRDDEQSLNEQWQALREDDERFASIDIKNNVFFTINKKGGVFKYSFNTIPLSREDYLPAFCISVNDLYFEPQFDYNNPNLLLFTRKKNGRPYWYLFDRAENNVVGRGSCKIGKVAFGKPYFKMPNAYIRYNYMPVKALFLVHYNKDIFNQSLLWLAAHQFLNQPKDKKIRKDAQVIIDAFRALPAQRRFQLATSFLDCQSSHPV